MDKNGIHIQPATTTVNYSSPIEIEGKRLTGKDVEFISNLQKEYDNLLECLRTIQKDSLIAAREDLLAAKRKAVDDLEKEKEEKDMMKNFNFGPCGDRAKISHLGIAVQNTNNEWVSYDKENGEIVNVDLINFGGDNFVYMIPVALKDVTEGDAIIHNHHVMFVTKVREKNLSVIDVTDGEIKRILPTKSIFGFDFITKIVSLVDFTASTANEDNPFGNILPFLLFNDNNRSNDVLPLAFMLMNKDGQEGGLFSSTSSMQTMFMAMMMMNNNNKDSNMQTLLPMMLLMNRNENTKTATTSK